MISSVLGFILGFAAAALIFACAAPFLWRRALFLARRVARAELPLSLKEIEADRDFLRARQAVEVCRLNEALDTERRNDYQRRLALSRGREQLAKLDRLEELCANLRKHMDKYEKNLAELEEQNAQLKEKARQNLRLKSADAERFRKQLQQIAAQTAGFIAAEQGADSPILHIIAPAGTEAQPRGSLAAAIAKEAAAAQKARIKVSAGT